MLVKLPRSGSDGVVIDCEDATPVSRKEEARTHALEQGTALIETRSTAVFVRVNGTDTPWFEADVGEALAPGLAGVVVPKIETIDQLDHVASRLDDAGHPQLGVLAGLETAVGVADARELLGHPRVRGAYFGAEDFVADMGGVRTADNAEVAYARSRVALAGRIAGVGVIDQIVADYSDTDRCRREANEARALGYMGKLCIHPAQVAIAMEAFSPSPDEIEAAQSVIAAYAEANEAGSGVIVVNGQMVDEALVAQARRVIAAVR